MQLSKKLITQLEALLMKRFQYDGFLAIKEIYNIFEDEFANKSFENSMDKLCDLPYELPMPKNSKHNKLYQAVNQIIRHLENED
jgi:hypothetical protein